MCYLCIAHTEFAPFRLDTGQQKWLYKVMLINLGEVIKIDLQKNLVIVQDPLYSSITDLVFPLFFFFSIS